MKNENTVSIYRVIQGARVVNHIYKNFILGSPSIVKETIWMYFEHYSTKYGEVMCVRDKSDNNVYNITASKEVFNKILDAMKRGVKNENSK